MEREVARIEKNREVTKNVPEILTLINSARFMQSSLSHLNNLSEGIHKVKCKYRNDENKC